VAQSREAGKERRSRMRPYDPLALNPVDAILASPTALMYVNLIVAGVLLLEARVLCTLLLRRQANRWPVLAPLGLAALAFALALYLWNLQGPHVLPRLLESFVGVPEPVKLLSIALVFITFFAPPPVVAVAFMSGKETS
jgi:hypothetical protein